MLILITYILLTCWRDLIYFHQVFVRVKFFHWNMWFNFCILFRGDLSIDLFTLSNYFTFWDIFAIFLVTIAQFWLTWNLIIKYICSFSPATHIFYWEFISILLMILNTIFPFTLILLSHWSQFRKVYHFLSYSYSYYTLYSFRCFYSHLFFSYSYYCFRYFSISSQLTIIDAQYDWQFDWWSMSMYLFSGYLKYQCFAYS